MAHCERCKQEIELDPLIREALSIDVFALPSMAADCYEEFPDLSTVYFAIVGGVIRYVGSTASLVKRWKHHPHLERLWRQGGRVAWIVKVDRSERLKFELESIKRFRPSLWNSGGGLYMARREINDRVRWWRDRKGFLREIGAHTSAFCGDIQVPPCRWRFGDIPFPPNYRERGDPILVP